VYDVRYAVEAMADGRPLPSVAAIDGLENAPLFAKIHRGAQLERGGGPRSKVQVLVVRIEPLGKRFEALLGEIENAAFDFRTKKRTLLVFLTGTIYLPIMCRALPTASIVCSFDKGEWSGVGWECQVCTDHLFCRVDSHLYTLGMEGYCCFWEREMA
jgi:hypothetical protein